MFLLWTAPPATAEAVVERLASHTRRVVFLSSPHQTPHPFFRQPNPMARLHAEIERLITAAGLESTFIRPGMFNSNARLWWAPTIRDGGVIRWPHGAAETAPIDERDLAAVAARTLFEEGHSGGDYVLTGPESLSQAEQVAVIGDVLGRQIPFEELSPDEFRRATEGIWPGPAVEMLLDAWGATVGCPAYVTSSVADVVGAPARTFRQWVSEHADAFRKPQPSSRQLSPLGPVRSGRDGAEPGLMPRGPKAAAIAWCTPTPRPSMSSASERSRLRRAGRRVRVPSGVARMDRWHRSRIDVLRWPKRCPAVLRRWRRGL